VQCYYESTVLASTDFIATKILFLRDEKVLLDADLALLYGVDTKRLKEAVRRNLARFPEDFMFELTPDEWTSLRTQIASLKSGRGKHPKFPPFAFTEQGVAMLSGILNSPRAIETNIAIMRTFVALRKLMESNQDLATKIRQLERKYDQRFKLVFDTIQQLIKQEKEARPIGFEIGRARKKSKE
jgi:ORF6N domain